MINVNKNRVEINRDILEEILAEIKVHQNLSLNSVSKVIGTNIKNLLYGTTNSIHIDNFRKLEKVYGKKISYKFQTKTIPFLHLEINQDLSEFVGIMLGDGGLYKNHYRIQISFNGVDEKEYVIYAKKLLFSIFSVKPKKYEEKNKKNATGKEKGLILYFHNKAIFNSLLLIGLKQGHKVRNQVKVPRWIKKNYIFVISCLKGLFDTDGSIIIDKKGPKLRLEFSNGSLRLVRDFKWMCEFLGIKTQPKLLERPWKHKNSDIETITYKVVISAKFSVLKFLYIIKPKKWDFNYEFIIKKLDSMGNSLTDVLTYRNKQGLNKYSNKILNKIYKS